MSKQQINITDRMVYPRGERRHKVYNAEGTTEDGIKYSVTAKTASDARKQALAQIDFIRANPSVEARGFRLYASDVGCFVFCRPGGGSMMCFDARNRDAALARVACNYADRPEIIDFVREALNP